MLVFFSAVNVFRDFNISNKNSYYANYLINKIFINSELSTLSKHTRTHIQIISEHVMEILKQIKEINKNNRLNDY